MVNEDKSQNDKNDCVVIDIENDTEEHTVERFEEKVFKPRIHDPVGLKPRVISVYYYQERNVGSQPTYRRGNAGFSSSRYDDDSDNDDFVYMDDFADPYIRNAFIRKVYFILSLQLIFTVVLICATIFIEKIRDSVREDTVGILIASITLIVVLIMVMCCQCARKTFPINFICLIALTVSFAYIAAFASASLDTKIVLMSIFITAAVCLSISVFACQTKFDITSHTVAFMFIVILGLMLIFTLMIISLFVYLKAADIIISVVLGLLSCLYLFYDTQMIMGGRRMEMAPDEYILGAICLYVDIMRILLVIMDILGRR